MPTMGLFSGVRPRRAVEGGVAEGEDAAVGGHQPVAVPARRGGHAHDGHVQRDPPRRSRRTGRSRSRRCRRRRRRSGTRCTRSHRRSRRSRPGSAPSVPSGLTTVTSTQRELCRRGRHDDQGRRALRDDPPGPGGAEVDDLLASASPPPARVRAPAPVTGPAASAQAGDRGTAVATLEGEGQVLLLRGAQARRQVVPALGGVVPVVRPGEVVARPRSPRLKSAPPSSASAA